MADSPDDELLRAQGRARLDKALAAARATFRERLARLKAATPKRPSSPAPRYDEVYVKGTAWLDGFPVE
jgi:hypothetical protein